jgi:hypothetical protein
MLLGETRSTDIVFVFLLFDLHRREALVPNDLTLSDPFAILFMDITIPFGGIVDCLNTAEV